MDLHHLDRLPCFISQGPATVRQKLTQLQHCPLPEWAYLCSPGFGTRATSNALSWGQALGAAPSHLTSPRPQTCESVTMAWGDATHQLSSGDCTSALSPWLVRASTTQEESMLTKLRLDRCIYCRSHIALAAWLTTVRLHFSQPLVST